MLYLKENAAEPCCSQMFCGFLGVVNETPKNNPSNLPAGTLTNWETNESVVLTLPASRCHTLMQT